MPGWWKPCGSTVPASGSSFWCRIFRGSREALATVLASGPDILAHNLETVPRLYPEVRRGADYRRSLKVLEQAKQLLPKIITKSGLMLGLGEEAHRS